MNTANRGRDATNGGRSDPTNRGRVETASEGRVSITNGGVNERIIATNMDAASGGHAHAAGVRIVDANVVSGRHAYTTSVRIVNTS